MNENAALLIDLENFYIGREEGQKKARPDDLYEFPVDLDLLVRTVRDLIGPRRLTVARAYANFNDRRPGEGDRRWDYYLQPLPRYLMEQGVEPVQVFRFPGGSNKNAADVRMALDAVALRRQDPPIDLFVFVTGDADFLPVVQDLRRSGAFVYVVGVRGSTKPIFRRYCDRFEYFEDLVAAHEASEDIESALAPIREALHRILERREPLEFAAVKPMLSEELGEPFDSLRFHCETTGDFLRRFADRLGVRTRKAEHDWELSRADSEGPSADDAFEKTADEGEETALDPSAAADGGEGEGPVADAHDAGLYRDLLKSGMPRCYVCEPAEWRRVVETVFRAAGGESEAERPAVLHRDLVEEAADALEEMGADEATRKATDILFQLFKAGCFVCADEGAEPDLRDFHWSRPARLAPEIRSPLDLSERTWRFLVGLLERRLEQRGGGEVRIEALADLLLGSDAAPEEREALERAVTERAAT